MSGGGNDNRGGGGGRPGGSGGRPNPPGGGRPQRGGRPGGSSSGNHRRPGGPDFRGRGPRGGAGDRGPKPGGRGDPRRYAPAPIEDPAWHFVEARRLMEMGATISAMEQVGLGIRLDTANPEGFLILGELNLVDGNLPQARLDYEAALKKAAAWGPGDDGEVDPRIRALAGLAHAARLAGDLPEAAKRVQEALRIDPLDPLGLGSGVVEMALLRGDLDAAARQLSAPDDAAPDEHLVAALVHLRRGEKAAAVLRVRLMLLSNLYLLAAVMGEEPPDHGLEHGFEEATPDYALEAAERLRRIFEDDPDLVDALAAIASTETVQQEVTELVASARALMREPDPARRATLQARVAELRDLRRLEATTPTVLAALDEPSGADDDDHHDSPCGTPPPSFDV